MSSTTNPQFGGLTLLGWLQLKTSQSESVCRGNDTQSERVIDIYSAVSIT